MYVNLKQIRTNQGLSQYRLAKKSGVRQGLISSYELGHKTPGLNNLVKLAGALEVSVSELLGEEPRKNKRSKTLPKTG